MFNNYFTKKLRNKLGNFSIDKYQEFNNITKNSYISFREKVLEDLILHSYHNIDYYKNIFEDLNITHGVKVDLNRFDELPILTKEIIKKNAEILTSKDFKNRGSFYNNTGGSTGEPISFIQDQNYLEYSSASNYYYYKNILNISEPYVKKIILWGAERDVFKGSIGPKAKIINFLTNTVILNSFRMSSENMGEYIKVINSYKPDLIRGYSGSLFELAQYAKSKKIDIHTPDVLVGAAETLNSEMREVIEEVFGTKIYNFYGAREVSNLAGECKAGLMHILPSNMIEIVDEKNKPVSNGERGKVIVTNLFNYSMPFLRYENGDMATLGPKKCKCGNPLPTLKKIDGRIIEHFILEDGTFIAGEYFIHLIGVLCNKGTINKFQVIQEDYNDLKIFVVSDLLDQTEIKKINQKIRMIMGQNCNIKWEFVSEIEKTANGKFLYTKSSIPK